MNSDEQKDGPGAGSEPPDTRAAATKRLSSKARAVVAAFGIAAVALVVGGVRLHGYVQNDQAFCFGSCHAGAAEEGLLALGAHEGIACEQCHDLQFAQNAWLYVAGKVQGPTADPPHAHADPKLCKSCHESGEGSRLQVTDAVGHQSHAREAKLECAVCHGNGTHALAAESGRCKTCHANVKMHEEAMADLPCESCHRFVAPPSELAATPSIECRTCHGGKPRGEQGGSSMFVKAGRSVSKDMIHGSIFDCSTCHQPHEKEEGKRRTGRDCARCHVRTPESAAAIKNPAHSKCGSCHREHSPRDELTATCADCHAQARPEALEDTPASRHANCGTCHVAHEFTADRASCGVCHREKSALANVERLSAHADCGNCHAPHKPEPAHDGCANCHKDHKGHGHANCSTCHDPHKDKSATKNCTSCHPGATVAAGKGHTGGCQTCHAPHAVGGSSARCASCHGQVAKAVAAAGDSPHGKCATCHRPHAFVASAGAEGCRSCHEMPAGGAHRGACSECHVTHGSPRVGTASCAKCHADIPRAKQGKHADCRSCHGPHEAASAGSAQCSSCHGSQQAGTRAWAASQHKDCLGCHKAHDPAAAASCSSCHAEVKVTGSKKHTCRGCHDPHQAPGNWQSRCASCHKGQAAATRSRGATHGNCASCHKPHHITKPSCTGCHNAMSNLGAHALHQQTGCTACHDTHRSGTMTRAQCLSCHKDMTDHNPGAKSCASCHPFR